MKNLSSKKMSVKIQYHNAQIKMLNVLSEKVIHEIETNTD